MADDMTDSTDESTKNWLKASRRAFLGASSAAVAGSLLGFTPQTASAAGSQTWDVHQSMTDNGWSADKAVSELISQASDGDTILFSAADGGTEYEIGDSHVINKSITLKGEDGAQLTRTSNWYGFKFQGPGLTGDIASMTGDVSLGDSTIPVDTSAVDFSVGDYVHIRNQDYYPISSVGAGDETFALQFAEVTGVSDGAIDISNPAYFNYSSNGGQVEKVELLEGPVVDGLTMVGDNNDSSIDYANTPSKRRGMFGMQWVKDGVYRNSSVKNYYASAFFLFDCWRATWDNVSAADSQSVGPGRGEGLKVAQTTGVQALSVTHKNCRRGIDIARGTAEAYIKDPVVENASLIGIGHHNNTGRYVSGRLRIEGGTLSADGTTIDHIEGQTYVTGTSIKTSGSGLGIAGDNFTAEDVTIEGTDGGSGDGHGVFVTGSPSNVGVHGKIVNNGAFSNSAVRITPKGDAENLLFDLDIESDYRFYGIGMTGNTYTDIVIRGTLSSSSANTDNAIYGTYHDAGVVDGLDISVDLKNHGGDGIYFLVGDRIERVKIHDSTLETNGNYGIWFGYDLSEEQKVEIDNVSISGSQYDAIYLEAPGTAYIGDVNTDGKIRTGDGLTLADSSYGYTIDAGNSNAAYESLGGISGGDSSSTPSNNSSGSGSGNNTSSSGNNTSSPENNTSSSGSNTSSPDNNTSSSGNNTSSPDNGTTTSGSNSTASPSNTTSPSNGTATSTSDGDDDSDDCPYN